MTVDGAAQTREPGRLEAAGLLDEAQIYHAMYRSSGGRALPRDVDDMHIWEIATCLGVSDELSAEESTGANDRSIDLLRQRVEHAMGIAEKPEARPISPEQFAAVTGALG